MQEKVAEFRNILVEKIAENDDILIEKFLNGEKLSNEEIKKGIRKLTDTNVIYPVFCGSALANIGVQKLLDGVVDYLPSPKDVANVSATRLDTGEQFVLDETVDEPFFQQK